MFYIRLVILIIGRLQKSVGVWYASKSDLKQWDYSTLMSLLIARTTEI